jgi:SAM-dependent methyltransferase
MPGKDFGYSIKIERGHSPINDGIISFLKERLENLKPHRWLDVGCNTGWLIESLGYGDGVDASEQLVQVAISRGLSVQHAWAESLPFPDKTFDVVVLSCILEQTEDWRKALAEAKRVGRLVIGINPYPGSPWGVIGGYVKSVIPPSEMGGVTTPLDRDRYYFEVSS